MAKTRDEIKEKVLELVNAKYKENYSEDETFNLELPMYEHGSSEQDNEFAQEVNEAFGIQLDNENIIDSNVEELINLIADELNASEESAEGNISEPAG